MKAKPNSVKTAKSRLKFPLREGDVEREEDENYAGMVFFNASSLYKPSVVDSGLEEIIDETELYSGCYGRVRVHFYAFDGKSKGIAAGFDAIQKTEDGKPLGSSVNAAEIFGDDEDDDLL